MTGMELYTRFMLTLTIGLVGVGLVLTTVLETVLCEWDPVIDIRRWWRGLVHGRSGAMSVRAEDILSEIEGRRESRNVYASRPPGRDADVRRASSPDFVEAL